MGRTAVAARGRQGALVDWAEHGTAPATLLAVASDYRRARG
ncbi:hypothetical protein [Saccharothrix saharensis]|nr:hypothetical protein [Saccharothrix saharensis]